MTKKDLRTGRQIEKRNGDRAIILLGTKAGDVWKNLHDDGCLPLGDLNEDLTCGAAHSLDVMKIFESSAPSEYLKDMDDECLIWERHESKIITIKGKEYPEDNLQEMLEQYFYVLTHCPCRKKCYENNN